MHSFPVRVYYEDTDHSGVVYHANYLKFFERARSEFVRERGVSQTTLKSRGEVFAIRAMNIEFFAPAVFDDVLEIKTSTSRIGGASIVLEQACFRGEKCLCKALVTVVLLDQNFRPQRVSDDMREMLNPEQG